MAEGDPRGRRALQRLDELRSARAGFDASWQLLSELMAPSRTFNLQRQPGELRTRFLRDAIGVVSAKRFASLLYGYMLSPTEPWVAPRLLDRDARTEEQDWFERVELLMHERLSGPTSSIATNLFEAALDIVVFGTNVTYRRGRPRQLPTIQALPLAQCYIGEGDEGETDTLARVFTRTARQVAERWPHPAIEELAGRDPKARIELLHLVEPRPGGVAGARRERKPWASLLVWRGKGVVLEEQGFDRFPFQVGRFERRSGEVYGAGPGWDAAPFVWTCNAMAESVLRAAELATDPPLWGDANVFGGRLDRRPGSFNPINAGAALLSAYKTPVGPLQVAGDVGIGVEMLERQRRAVEQSFYLDWLSLREGPQMTATEVNDRRDQRLRLLAPVVARLEQEWLNPLVEDFFFAMLREGYLPPPPQSLAGEEIGFVYRSPLALARRGAHVDAYARAIEFATMAMQVDQSAGQVLRADEMVRKAAKLIGVQQKELRSFEELEALRAAAAEREAAADDMAATQVAAGALQQGAQGLATLQQAQAA